ncbi:MULTISPECIES: tyrosine-type recombinase/integrase [Pasteurellaceae]|uniref:tyrosine-type recombinase/integrase n=1 Tax=Pasteurellaceae TaxID=712 RepID=UPI00352AD894
MNIIQQRFPDRSADSINNIDLITWRNEILDVKIKPVTWNNYVRHLKAIYNVGIKYNILQISNNPFYGLFIKESKRKKKTLSKKQLDKLSYALNGNIVLPEMLKPSWFINCLVMTLRCTGIRRSQLVQLQIQDVDLNRRIIYISPEINKNHDYHIVPISDNLYPHIELLVEELRKQKQPLDSQLFNFNLFSKVTRRKGKPMSVDQVTHIFRRISEVVGFTSSPHRFRHTVATSLMKNPENVYVVQKLLGHKDISVTLGYIEHDVEMLRDSVNLL